MNGRLSSPLTRSVGLVSRTRQHALRMHSGAGLGLGIMNPVLDAEAKKKKKKCKPKPPVLDVAIVTCPGPLEISHSGARRYAQTFIAQQTGVITAATVDVANFPEGMDFLVDIRAVDGDEEPTNEVLASDTINDLPATSSVSSRSLSAFFDPPAKVQNGTRYALVLTDATGGQSFAVPARTGDECQGQAFNDATASGAFEILPTADLIFTLSVVFAR